MRRRGFLLTGASAACLPLTAKAETPPTQDEALSALAREAYVYAYPIVENYLSLYQYAIDTSSDEYKGPMNAVANVARVFTPEDTGVTTPNSDTPYSFLVMDLRAEPLVVTLPAIEEERYYSVQLIDLYSHNTGYLGTRSDGNAGGRFLVAGPDWDGEVPEAVTRVIRMDTQIGLGLFRTQLFSHDDIDRVIEIQSAYRAEPLSAFAGTETPPPSPPVDWPAISRETAQPRFWDYANFLLQFAPPLPWETDLRDAFGLVGMTPAERWPALDLGRETEDLVVAAGQSALDAIAAGLERVTTSVGLFGSPDDMRGKEMERAIGAMGGLYGNSAAEAIYPSYMVDADGVLLDASRRDYVMRFPEGALPPVDAFWSLTMYDARTRLLVPNPLGRYLINSAMMSDLVVEPDGDIVLHLRKESPGEDREANWLPAPDGPFSAVLRLYLPRAEALDGQWTAPAIEPADE
jgi:hypothetical protein